MFDHLAHLSWIDYLLSFGIAVVYGYLTTLFMDTLYPEVSRRDREPTLLLITIANIFLGLYFVQYYAGLVTVANGIVLSAIFFLCAWFMDNVDRFGNGFRCLAAVAVLGLLGYWSSQRLV